MIDYAAEVTIFDALLESAANEPERAKKIFELLEAEDFQRPSHQELFKQYHNLYRSGLFARDLEVMFDLYGQYIDMDARRRVGVTWKWHDYATLLIQVRRRNELRQAVENLQSVCLDPSRTMDDLSVDLLEAGKALNDGRTEGCSETAEQATDNLLERCAKTKGTLPSIFHMPTLDRLLFLPRNSYVVVGARPSVGKTAFGLSCCYNAGLIGTPVGFISQEMVHEDIMARLLSMQSHLSFREITEGERVWDDKTKQRVYLAAANLKKMPIHVAGKGRARSIQQICQTCREWVHNYGVKQIFIDYYQIINLDGKGTRYEKFCNVSTAVLDLKNELSVPIFMLAQLGREFDTDRMHSKRPVRPQMKHLKECGGLEQDADMVILLDRPNMLLGKHQEDDLRHDYTDSAGIPIDMEDRVALCVVKNRNGHLCTPICSFSKKDARFC